VKRKRFTEEQIIGILKEHELGAKTADVCRMHRISEATFYIYGTTPPWQEGCDCGLTCSIANIYPASPDDGTPKWGIRSHLPRQVAGLEGHYRSQGFGVPERPVSPSDPSRNLR
jgi:hypothetical protein